MEGVRPTDENGDKVKKEDEEELKRASMDSTKTSADEDEALNLYKDLVEKSAGNNGKKDAFHMDGDYLILIEARKNRKANSGEMEPTLWNLLESSDENFVPARAIANKSREELKSVAEGISAEQTRLKMFGAISKKDLAALEEFFKEHKKVPWNLTTLCYREPNSAKTALHHAIDCESWDIATNLINKGGHALITETFSLKIDGSHTTKNALHQLSEKGKTTVVQALLSKLTDKAALNEYLRRTTLVKAPGQRPREMMCMHVAALYGHDELVKLFLSLGIEGDIVNKKSDTPLLWAVRGGHETVVNTLLDENCDVNHENDKGSTPVYWSVRYGHTHILLNLIKRGRADVNKKRKMGFVTPIILASAMGYAEIVNILAENGADVNITIRNGETALQHAAAEGNQKVIKNLIVHGAHVDAADEAGNTPLALAAKHQHAAATYLLASAGANLDHVTHEGKSVWHYAVESATNDVLIGLVEYMRRSSEFYIHGIENIVQFPVGNTPLHIAAEKGDFEKVKCLLRLGVDRTCKDDHGNNFLHVAAKHNNKLIIKTYGEKDNINEKNSDGDTVLLIACKNGNFEAAFAALKHAKADDVNIQKETALHLVAKNSESDPAFVERLVDVMIKKHSWTVLDAKDERGNTALHVAANHASPSVIQSLRFLDVKAENQDGAIPLHIAARRGNWESFDAFLSTFGGRGKELNYDHQNSAGESLLHIVAQKRNIKRVKQLIFSGTDIDLQDSDGNTVLHLLTQESIKPNVKIEQLLNVFIAIVDGSVWWWCVQKQIKYPADDVTRYNALKRESVLFLLTSVINSDAMSVLQLAGALGAKDILETILNIREVFKFKAKSGFVKYDVTNLTPDTLLVNGIPQHAFGRGRRGSSLPRGKVDPLDVGDKNDTENPAADKRGPGEPHESLVETIVRKDNLDDLSQSPEVVAHTVRMFDVTPLNKMVGNYWSKYQWLYAMLMFVHILYMGLFSGFISDYLPKSTDVTIIDADNRTVFVLEAVPPLVWPSILFLTWPIILVVYGIYSIVITIFSYAKNKRQGRGTAGRSLFDTIFSVIMFLFTSGFGIVFALLVITWYILYMNKDTAYQDFIVALSLCLGWLYTIQYTKGFRNIHHFSLMLRHMIINDVIKFLIFYFFVLFAFTMAFHSLFHASAPLSSAFVNVLDTAYFVYNIMIGMADFTENVSDEDFQSIGKSRVFIKIVYIFYTILSNIVLLNMLIALMNDSYSRISSEQTNNWRVNSVLLALDIEKESPILPKIFYALRRQTDSYFDEERKRWYITLPRGGDDGFDEMEEETAEHIRKIEDRIETVEDKLGTIDEKLNTVLKQVGNLGAK